MLGLVVAAIVAAPAVAYADDPAPTTVTVEVVRPMPTPHLRLSTGSAILTGPDGHLYDIPQGSHVITPEIWKSLDDSLINAEDDRTRLQAENKSLRETASGWQPGWRTLLVTLGTGLAGGWYLAHKL